MREAFLGLATLALGCGANDDEFTCDMSLRDGTYLVSFETLSGDCGSLPASLTRLEADAPLPDGCELDAPDDVSPDECTLERSYTCDLGDGYIYSYVAISDQDSASGSVISGLVTMSARDASTGAAVCVGTYEIRAVRQ